MSDQQATPRGERKLRSDTRRNRRRLLEAVGELAREAPDELAVQAVASRAEIGPATAYRYFSSMEEVLAAYVLSVVEELSDFTATSTAQGRPLFMPRGQVGGPSRRARPGAGSASVPTRLPGAFRIDGNEIIATMRDAWDGPVRGLLDDIGLPEEMLEYALFLNNMIFDPREVQDLLRETHLSRREVITRLIEAYCGALRGWARVG